MKNLKFLIALAFLFISLQLITAGDTYAQDIFGRATNPDTLYLNPEDFNRGEIIQVDTSGGVNIFTGVDASGLLGQPLKYVAYITQTGSSAPTVEYALMNTLGATATYSRLGAGSYRITFSSAVLTSTKTTFEVKPIVSAFNFDVINGYIHPVNLQSFSTTAIDFFSVGLDFVPADDLLEQAVIEITVYP